MDKRSGDYVRDRIKLLAKLVFDFEFDQYLSRDNRCFWGITIDQKKHAHEVLFDNPHPKFLEIINEIYQKAGDKNNAEAGYRTSVGALPFLSRFKLNADVFLINRERLADNELDLDALLIHELCHMVIDSGMIHHVGLSISNDDKECGDRLYQKTDYWIAHTTRHDKLFCQLLCAAARKAFFELKKYSSCEDIIRRAMKHGDMIK